MTSISPLRSFFPVSHRVYTPDRKLPSTTQRFERAGFRSGAVMGETCAFVPRLVVGLTVRPESRMLSGGQVLRATGLLGLLQHGLTGAASTLGAAMGCALGLVTLPVCLARSGSGGAHIGGALALGSRLGANLVWPPVQGIEGVRAMGAFALGLSTLLIAHLGAVVGASLSDFFIEPSRALEA